MELCKKITDVLEAHDMTIHGPEIQKSTGREIVEIYAEIEFFSPAGEDVIETIWFDGTDAGFIEAFRKNAEDFDPDKHAEMWVECRGEYGVPDSIRELIDDADTIKADLLEVAEALEALKI